MDEKKRTSEYPDSFGEYRTGSTEPPKNHGGLITFLLIAVIFLSGIASALGLLNIHLFRQLETLESRASSPVSFYAAENTTAEAQAAAQSSTPRLGITGDSVSLFWQQYRRLPAGVYVTSVTEGGPAYNLGIAPGDILLSFDGQRISDIQAIKALLQAKSPGDRAQLLVYRNGKQLLFSVTLDEG